MTLDLDSLREGWDFEAKLAAGRDGGYVRTHEGDRHAREDTVRRMFSDASERPPDSEILKHFTINDLDSDSLATFRNLFKSNLPGHPFMAGDDREMLRQLGGWAVDRSAENGGLTLAGLLMFGRQRSILDHLPHYHLDYRHLPSSDSFNAPRWLDRVTLDGLWPGNLLEFYRKVIPKLRDGLQIPFKMGEDLFRKDETPQHEALREATVNTLIHADYMGRGGIRIFRLPHGFEFNNPGRLRLPAEQVRSGGKSDCRNPSLQLMFQMIGAGEKAGSGFPKILQAWREQDWRAPALEEDTEQEEVCLRLTTISLFPPEVTAEMERRFPKKMHLLDENGRLALATAILEGSVTNERLQELTDQHPRDLTFLLKNLVKKGFLAVREKRRWSTYTLALEETHKGHGRSSLPHKNGSLPRKNGSLPHKDGRSQHNGTEPNGILPDIVREIRSQQRSTPDKMEEAILILCDNKYVMPQEFADMLNRKMKTLKNHLSKLVRQGKLVLRFPDHPTHPAQAYQAARTAGKGEKHGD